jgi:hypothetical protein
MWEVVAHPAMTQKLQMNPRRWITVRLYTAGHEAATPNQRKCSAAEKEFAVPGASLHGYLFSGVVGGGMTGVVGFC